MAVLSEESKMMARLTQEHDDNELKLWRAIEKIQIRIEKLEDKLYEKQIEKLDEIIIERKNHQPWQCPACMGWGFKIDNESNERHDCKGCEQKGYIWG